MWYLHLNSFPQLFGLSVFLVWVMFCYSKCRRNGFVCHTCGILAQQLGMFDGMCGDFHIFHMVDTGICCCRPCHLSLQYLSKLVVGVTSLLGVLDNDFMCVAAASFARHMSSALSSVRSDSFSSLLRVRSSFVPHTIRSLIRLSVSVPNSQDFSFILRSVTYWSIDSSSCWFLVLKTCLSQVTFFLGCNRQRVYP